MQKYICLAALFFPGVLNAQSDKCAITKENIESKAQWVLAEGRVNNSYYQRCLKGVNTIANVKKFIDCMENTNDCRLEKTPGYCDNFCPNGKEKTSMPAPTSAKAELTCTGGVLSGGAGACTSIVDTDPKKINFLSFNLYWWSAFGPQLNGRDIIKNIKARMLPADLIAFQECSDVRRVLNETGLSCYQSYDAGHAVALAWNPEKFEKLSANRVMVGLDQGYARWNANRVLGFVRLKIKETGQTIFFANIHGVLEIGTGGIPIRNNCEFLAHGDDHGIKDGYISRYKKEGGNHKTFAQNIVDVIKANIMPGDILILAGDFNIDKDQPAEAPLKEAFERVAADWVDKIFINKDDKSKLKIVPAIINRPNGSDHNAIKIEFSL